MLANDRIKFLNLHLVRHGALVFAGGVVVPGSGRRYEFNFFSHNLDLYPAGTNISNDLINTQLINNPHTFSR